MNEHIELMLDAASTWAAEAEARYKGGSFEAANAAARIAQAHSQQAQAHRVDVQTSLMFEFFTWHYGPEGRGKL